MSRALHTLAVAVFVAGVAIFSASGQAQTQRVAGTIEGVDGATLVIKTREGEELRVNITDSVMVYGVVKATLAEIKPGDFVGVGAMPQADGSQKAIQIMIFSEAQRGT